MLQYMLLLLVICLFWLLLLLLGITCPSVAPVIFVCIGLCSQGIIWTFSSGTGPCLGKSWHWGTKSFVYLCHGTVKMSAPEIRAEERCLSAAEVVAL